MTKKHNFNPGPAVMPPFTVEKTIEALKDYGGTGLSIIELSHRSNEFKDIMAETQALFTELLEIPEGYSVLFLGGGASTQFFMIPYNLMKNKAAYLNTGSWATKAIKEAKFFGEVIEVASSADRDFSYIPKDYEVPADADYFHITTNNTIKGTAIFEDYDVDVPLVADMSSDIFGRRLDVSKYGIIYGGNQKNVGPAGATFVIVKEDILGKVDREIPTMIDYRTHISKDSMYNTPPVVNVFSALQTLKWFKSLGGVPELEKMNIKKAELLYNEVDRNKLFVGPAVKEDRSRMNVCFILEDEYKHLESEFLEFAAQKGMVGVKGHRSVGGFRASIYNALPIESVQALVDCMQEFEAQH
ncbi:MAG: MFS transporter [Anaerolineae bacterium SM23_ 63]|nr:MAG: MFS transporter [Anaerolineae bacterium SM23_ 63]HEY48203.1 3-phosphoserine/phosphohydroxythreonine transaminase [Anaerolineae bacterium]